MVEYYQVSRAVSGSQKSSAYDRENKGVEALLQLGEHPNPRFQLKVPDAHKAIFYGLNHFEIQYHPLVAEQIVRWFYPSVEDEAFDQIHEYLMDLDSLEGIALT